MDINTLLKNVVAHGASDLHLVSRSEPQIRIDGKLAPLNLAILDGQTIEKMCYTLITDKQKKQLEEHKEVDFAIAIPNVGRFRGNYYYTFGNELAAAFRIIPTEIPTLDDLNAPAIFKEIIKREKGLILVTGPTGSGKSTTLAALINEINMHEHKHIITVEDPVEFIHQNKKSLFSHRNVGEDTKSFSSALKYAMREDPDIILVGEMRDKETIEAALTAAETGHLVFGTLHTNSAVQTINRIVDTFDGSEQLQIRNMLSISLACVISQMLLPKKTKGRVAAQEIMINNHAISNLIRENKIHQLYSQMQLNQANTGMQTQTQALAHYVEKNIIRKEDALHVASQPEELKGKIGV
ncbi:MAG TPA: type IV pilus twitching motility protein PilT [Campylobacterales bacterium]|nr:type IV pilus twitching motility protein PilT [Campylobacterales bacterium]